jgi:16S rRNA (uracil1498-N3)-methyltransferase
MLPRFFAPDLDPSRADVLLPEDEAKHLTRVVRLGAGDEVSVFDGRGHEFLARVADASRHAVRLELVRPLDALPESGVPFVFGQAILKGAKMDDVVRDATMLGARGIVPLVSDHVAVKGAGIAHGRPADRWRRVALASAKQCGRATLPDVPDPRQLGEWLANGPHIGLRVILVEPGAAPGGTRPIRSLLDRDAPASAVLLAGPEGGWSGNEVRTAIDTGYEPVTLGPLTLRADAIAVAAMSVFRVLWDEGPAPTSPPPRPTP